MPKHPARMTLAKHGLIIVAAITAGGVERAAADITLMPVAAQHEADRDKDRIWPDRDFVPEGEPPVRPDIYSARAETADGVYFLSQITKGCKGFLCPFQLRFFKKGGGSKLLLSGYEDVEGIMTISSDLRRATFGAGRTEETVTIEAPGASAGTAETK